MTLLDRIKTKEARVVVVGAGYVGLPLAVEVAKAKFQVTAYDKSVEKVDLLNKGVSYIKDVPSSTLGPLVKAGTLTGSADPEVLGSADVIIICVPTPLNKTKDPDNSFIMDAAEMLAARMNRPQLIVLESTTFPGFTREALLPLFVQAGRKPDEDFFLAFSPERVDPGNPKYFTHNTPKVLGGISPKSLEVAKAMYGHFIETIVPVASTDAAEMVKLLENTFRAVNIGLVNEVAIMCGKLGLDTWEVIQAAASKPFGFMPFYPGPGLGGHCIPIDPLYLSWKLKTLKYNARFISLADEVNSSMPEFVEVMVADALNARRKAVRGSRILVCGVTYKRDIDDVRESPALDIIELLQRRGAEVNYSDPYAPTLRIGEHEMKSVPIETAGTYDCVLITTDHRNVDYAALCDRAQLVVDTRNATRALREKHADKIVSL
ncbi:MAG TPA: nucleotide sugar dehydrogenase [Polyangia bacterium]|nr:nucleotide sugar dehydrogenase [Polyangia bacterium]